MFKLGKSEFKVEEAVLSASFVIWDDAEDTEFVWCLEMDMEEGELVIDEEDEYSEELSPRLYHENGFRIDVQSWKELEGVALEWEEEENDNGEDAGFIYMGYHAAITQGKIEFLKRNGDKFLVRWSGMAEDEVPFEFEGEVHFRGILADCMIEDLKELESNLMEFTDMEGFECVKQSSYDNSNGKRYRYQFVSNMAE